MRWRRIARIGAILAGVAVVLALAYVAMIAAFVGRENKPEGVTIVNGIDSDVVVFIVAQDGREVRVANLAVDGVSHPVVGRHDDPCTSSDLIARTSDGMEVDRRPPPFCAGEEWVVSDGR
jgi:hypothetical protein